MACTLVVSFYPQSAHPLVVAANRDESPNRPAEPWAIRSYPEDEYYLELSGMIVPSIYCPMDVLGGTWIGCNSMGVFAAITNWDTSKRLHGLRSRGKVVLETLRRNNTDDILYYWNGLKAEDYKPFNIIAGTKDMLLHLSNDHKEMYCNRLGAGLHISTGRGFNLHVKRDKFIRSELKEEFYRFDEPISDVKMQSLLSAHNDGYGSEDSVCVHDVHRRWETRSSAVLKLYPKTWDVRFNEGPPCKANDEDWKHGIIQLEKYNG